MKDSSVKLKNTDSEQLHLKLCMVHLRTRDDGYVYKICNYLVGLIIFKYHKRLLASSRLLEMGCKNNAYLCLRLLINGNCYWYLVGCFVGWFISKCSWGESNCRGSADGQTSSFRKPWIQVGYAITQLHYMNPLLYYLCTS